MMEFKSVPIEIKEVSATGCFEGWASVFDVEDAGGDTVKRGAFVRSLKSRTPKIYLEHNTSVGVMQVAEEREKGLWVAGQPDDSPDGLAARAKLKSRALDALSIGYNVANGGSKETGRFKRDLLDVDLFHVGLVPFGMNEEAVITTVKALDLEGITTLREVERTLRDAGFSQKEAKYLLSIAKSTQRDSDEATAELAEAIETAASHLRQLRSTSHGSARD